MLAATPARAQFTPRTVNDPPTGEKYHIEASIGLWRPVAQATIASEQFNIPGTNIDLKKDLGLTDQTFSELHLVLRPTKRNKFRFQRIPIKYEQEATLTRDIVFQGQRYRVGVPVNSQLDWKAYRFAYEFDFITTNRGFVGFLLDAKYTDVGAALQSPLDNESYRKSAPIPAVGGIARVYVVPNISITGELSGFKLPENMIKDYQAHYIDLDIYGTVNITNNFGGKIGYRSFDVGYAAKGDSGSFVLKGLYFNAVARF